MNIGTRDLALLFGLLFLICAVLVKLLGEDFTPNTQLFLLINGAQATALNPIMLAFSDYGEYFWIPVIALLFILERGERRRLALLLVATFLLALFLEIIFKLIIAAPRPTIGRALISGEVDPSFPSGHATIVSVGAIFFLTKYSRRVSWPTLLEALPVTYSRVYLGVHWPIDVLAGWLLGGFCVFLVLFLASEIGFYPVHGKPSTNASPAQCGGV